MAGATRRCRFIRDRLAWIRRRTGPKQRGVKLRTSSSESDGDAAFKVAQKVGSGGDAASKVGLKVAGGDTASKVALKVGGDGDAASKVALKVGGGGDAAPKAALKVEGDADVASNLALKVGDGGDGGSCGPNTGTCGCDGSQNLIVEVGGNGDDDISYSPMSGCCNCNLNRKHLVAEEGDCEGFCPRNLGKCDSCGSLRHFKHGRLRSDGKGQLYVLDSEAEDSDLEESCRPVLRRGQGAFGRRLDGGEMTEEMVQYMEQCLTGIAKADREVFIPWIKIVIASTYTLN